MVSPFQPPGPIECFMVQDHVRIDGAFARAVRCGSIDADAFGSFRHDLLRHIAMEEKVLLPFARAKRGGDPLPFAAQLRSDHGAIAKLLVRAPSIERADALRVILGAHNALEEGPDGLYAICDELAGDEALEVVRRLLAQPQVKVAPYYDGPIAPRS